MSWFVRGPRAEQVNARLSVFHPDTSYHTLYPLRLYSYSFRRPGNEPTRRMTEIRLPGFPAAIPGQILHGVGEGITLADRRGRIVFSNEAADRILGVRANDAPPDEWAGHYGVFDPEDRVTPFPTARYPLVRALEGEETRDVEMFVRNTNVPDGALISVTGRPLRGGEDEIVGAVVVFRDITALREAQEQLERTNAELAEIQRQKDELAAFVVHDLKSPLTGIMLAAEELMQGADPGSDEWEALEDIHGAAATLHSMVLDLLDIRLAEEGGLKPAVTSFRVMDVLIDVADSLRKVASATGTTLAVEQSAGDVELSADPELLRRVLQNLADNCFKYSPGGTVTLSARPEGASSVLITVEDDGSGVPVSLRDEIFRTWTTAERDERERHRDSRGIGLYFCRLAVEAHGGRIWVEDSEPRGARFCVEIPSAVEPS